MPNVTAYLDCGCAILEGGSRTWCPTCEARGFDWHPKNPVLATEGFPSDVPALQEELREALRRYNTLADYVGAAWDIIDGSGDIDSIYSALYQTLERANDFLNNPRGTR